MRRAVFSLLACLLVLVTTWSTVPASAAGDVFDDVHADTPFAVDIEWLAAEGITDASAQSFRPDSAVTRQAMAVFLYKFANPGQVAPACSTAAYPDVPKTSPYCGSVRWLATEGITSGTSSGGFAPLDPVTRQSMAAFLYKVHSGGTAPPACTARAFDDVPKSSPFCGAVRWLSREGITTGDPGGDFHPTGTVTRGIMAAFLHRLEPLFTAEVGADVSYPQCGKALPAGQAFGIVGLIDETNWPWNPCFTTQMTWADGSLGGTSQPKAQVYVVTDNPGPGTLEDPHYSWPTTGSTPYGTCAGADDEACAYQYGWDRATEGLGHVTGAQSLVWWLDVDITAVPGVDDNRWNFYPGGAALNVAVLEGMADALLDAGVAEVGLHSTAYRWTKVTGTAALRSDSPLRGRPSWLAGATSLRDAMSRCTSSAPLTAGGTVELVQYEDGGFHRDFTCG